MPPPVITSPVANPPVIYAGQWSDITVQGQNFGNSPGYFDYCVPAGSGRCTIPPSNQIAPGSQYFDDWSPTLIHAKLLLPVDAHGQPLDVVVRLGTGDGILGYEYTAMSA